MIVFLTVYLGLIAGRQAVEMRVDAPVTSVQVLLDGNKVVTLASPPWRTVVDLGAGVEPHEIVAAGFNDKGEEITRTTQIVNVPRPTAEVEIALDAPHVKLVPRHVGYAEVRSAKLMLDEHPLSLDKKHAATLPRIDMKRPHVLTAEVKFVDGAIARRELVFGGEFGESTAAQLTPIAITGDAKWLASLKVNATEKPAPLVIVVRDPDATEIDAALVRSAVRGGTIDSYVTRRAGTIEPRTTMRLMSAVARRATAANEPTAVLFPTAPDVDGTRNGLYSLITSGVISGVPAGPRQWADATAVAGVQAFASGRRRAVVLVLGSAADASGQSPASVRKYLATLGVPLFVWSTGPRAADGWGEVEDVSTLGKVTDAAAKVRAAVDAQTIAWISGDPISVLREANAHE